jgi:hypothetical protein
MARPSGLEIVFDMLGFADEIGYVLIGRFREPRDHAHVLLELLDKLLVFLVPPSRAQSC